MDRRQWLDVVRPLGRGFVFTLKNGTPRQISFTDNDEADTAIASLVSEHDVFVTLAKFRDDSPSRKNGFAESFSSVWLDIDCGKNKPYKNQHDAIKALKAFCQSTKLPKPSTMINSGNGVHIYWCFEEAVDANKWMSISNDLKSLCISKSFFVDPAVMGDTSRVMRVPDSYNYKNLHTPKKVWVMHPSSNELKRFCSYKLKQSIVSALQLTLKAQDSVSDSAAKNKIDETTHALMGRFSPVIETVAEIARLESALDFLSPDVGRGHGSFYDSNENSEPDYWLAAVWAIASLGWDCGKEIAEGWSQKSNRFTEYGFDQAWIDYNPNHSKPITIGSLYKRAKELGWQDNAKTSAIEEKKFQISQPRFKLLEFHELCQLPSTQWLIKGILPSKGLASIYGPSGSGKTFLALDLLLAIAVKSDWFGFKVKNVPVAYVCLEGMGGITRRIQAWHIKHNTSVPSNFKIILDNFNLMNRNQVEQLAEAINQVGFSSSVIVIDTLNQASPAADENSSKDMGLIISHLKLLQELTNSLVLIIHHTGKNTAAGLRGHSSLKAALDTNIEVVGGDSRSWSIEKNKDGEDGGNYPFKLEVQKVGSDSDGHDITSCAVERDFSAVFKRPEPSGKTQKTVYQLIKRELSNSNVLSKCQSGSQTKCMKVEDAITKVTGTLSAILPNKRTYRARTLISGLISGGYINSGYEGEEAWLWLT